MAKVPRTLKNFQLFVDGRGYAGLCPKATLPELNIQTEEHRAGGMDAAIELDMGMEAMEFSFSLSEYDPDVLRMWGLGDGASVPITLRGALKRDGEEAVPAVATLRGMIKTNNPGDWEAGSPTEAEFTMSVRYYRFEVAGEEIWEIDVENMIRKVGGVDVLASIRNAIGA